LNNGKMVLMFLGRTSKGSGALVHQELMEGLKRVLLLLVVHCVKSQQDNGYDERHNYKQLALNAQVGKSERTDSSETSHNNVSHLSYERLSFSHHVIPHAVPPE
jgi:hypothetical protein